MKSERVRRAVAMAVAVAMVIVGGCTEHSALMRRPKGSPPGQVNVADGGRVGLTPVATDTAVSLIRANLGRAASEVAAAASSPDPYLRANAMEAAEMLPEARVELLRRAMSDPNPAVRFAALATIGRGRVGEIAGDAAGCLGDENPSVRAAAIFALARNRQPVDQTPLAGMVRSPDPTVRGNAVMLLGMMGEASAVPMLKEAVHEPMPGVSGTRDAIVRLQFAESVTKLGDYSNLNSIRAGAYSTLGEVQVLAVILLGDLQDRTMAPALRQMLAEPPVERQVAAATSLAKMGQFHGLETVLKASKMEGPLQRAQAAMGLGYFDADAAVERLVELLGDSEGQVRLSAAAGLLRMERRLAARGTEAEPGAAPAVAVDKPLTLR